MVKLLSGPNFELAPITSFNIEGTHIFIPIPDECYENTKSAESNIDSIDTDAIYDITNPDFFLIKYLLKTEFSYSQSDSDHKIGDVYASIDLLKVDQHRPESCVSLFSREDFLNFYLSILKGDEVSIVKSINDKEKTDKYLIIPKSIEEIKELKFEGASWLFAVSGYAEVTKPYRRFITPITNNHILSIMVSIGGFDFGSVELEQELVAEADQYILDFIKSIRIDYSPETLAEIQRVRGDVTA